MARRYLPIAAFAGLIVAIQLATLFTGTAFHLTQLTMTAYYSLIIVGLCMLIGYERCRYAPAPPFASTRPVRVLPLRPALSF